MTGRRIFFILLTFIVSQSAFTRKIRIKATDEPLSSVVKRLNAEVSFDNHALSVYHITVDKSFSSPDAAILYLLKDKPLQMSRVAGVYVITAKTVSEKNAPHKTQYKYVVKHLPDTLSMNLSMSLKEIVITAHSHTPSLKGEDVNGVTHFTSLTANVMPGYSDNSVFNVLRMMPGIRASGEPSDELYVWGSSPGESRVTLDGIPLFSMQSYNSNISYINPYMSDEVRYKRGIMSASDGSQTGAKVDVVSGTSQVTKPVIKAMVSTMSANVFAAVPLSSKCMISVAYRHTLESIFKGTTFDAYRKKDDMRDKNTQSRTKAVNGVDNTSTPTPVTPVASLSSVPIKESPEDANPPSANPYSSVTGAETDSSTTTTITTKYQFQDVNLNIAGMASGNTVYKISMYGAKDYLDYDSGDTLNNKGDQTSYQGGISANVAKTWQNGNKSELSSFFSGLYSEQNGNYMSDMSRFNYLTTEKVSELNLKYQQSGIGFIHGLSLGGELTMYRVFGSSVNKRLTQPTVFANERYTFGPLSVEAGLRTDFMSGGLMWQPRTMLKYSLLRYFTLTASWGIYNQYLVKNPFPIYEGSYQFGWDLNPILKSYNTIAGIAFERGRLNVYVEGYLKRINNSIWVVNDVLGQYDFNLKGLDVSAKYNWRHGLLFASWSVSDDPRQTNGAAHEIKAGGIMRFYPFTLSANYVFGHGYNSMLLPSTSFESQNQNLQTPTSSSSTTYSRMDIYASYEKKFKYVDLTIGTSLINVFDTNNQKYVTSWMPRSESNSFSSQASRFTPIVFFEVKF
jgi:ferric enterobactin receptor